MEAAGAGVEGLFFQRLEDRTPFILSVVDIIDNEKDGFGVALEDDVGVVDETGKNLVFLKEELKPPTILKGKEGPDLGGDGFIIGEDGPVGLKGREEEKSDGGQEDGLSCEAHRVL